MKFSLTIVAVHDAIYLCICFILFCLDIGTHYFGRWNNRHIQPYDSRIWNVWYTGMRLSCRNLIIQGVLIVGSYESGLIVLLPHCSWWHECLLLIPQLIVFEGLFYTFHRLLHAVPTLRKYHTEHHSFDILVPTVAYSCSVTEMIMLNFIPLFICFFMISGGKINAMFFAISGGYASTMAHSGYEPSRLHYIHHKYVNKNYGFGLFIFDKILNTFQSDCGAPDHKKYLKV
jgi:sterol desaturase/sphingolipid hydroxylase (fatty acid hydroxylase superfamily)